jgi:ATP-dependent Clp protease ATP-binding subunit ClpC
MAMFERYTQQARRAIYFARLEAVHRRASAISTTHLLLGLSWEENSRAAIAGSLKDRLMELCPLLGVQLRPCTDIPYKQKADIPLDRNSKIALAYTAQEANADWSSAIETDHLLRGLLRFTNEASEALNAVGIDLKGIRSASKQYRRERISVRAILGRILGFSRSVLNPALISLAIMAAAGLLVALLVRLINR